MQPVTLPVIPEPPDRVEVVIRWAASMGLDTNALVLRRATREVVALPEPQFVVRIAAARAANVLSATREVAAGRLLAQAGVPAERLAPVGPQPLRLGAAVATVWGLVPHTARRASPAQIGVLARRLHDATVGVARRYGAPASDVESLVDGYGDDPRGWVGFETCCQVYELWATAWALSQPDPDAVAEGVVRAASLSGNGGRLWQLR